jgi:hypothetical protein
MRGALFLVLGTALFVAITFFEQIPVIGWLGGVVSIAAWIALTRTMLEVAAWDIVGSGIGLIWAAVLGGVTGFFGALTAWMAQTGNLFGFTTTPGDRFGAAFGFVGASLGLVYWPLIGALVCAVTAFAVMPARMRSR